MNKCSTYLAKPIIAFHNHSFFSNQAVVISHNHYDHLDYNTVTALADLQPDIHWFVPDGVGRWLQVRSVFKLGWYVASNEREPLFYALWGSSFKILLLWFIIIYSISFLFLVKIFAFGLPSICEKINVKQENTLVKNVHEMVWWDEETLPGTQVDFSFKKKVVKKSK